jgi:aspartyl-tRNA(Asn)/glutamyl-tRNA(Gln) amidotransferase subunit C
MALSGSEISRIARLARVELGPGEEQLYAEQLGRVVDYIDQIARVEASLPRTALEPLVGAPRAAGDQRSDEPAATLDLADFLRNAPAALDRFLVVPQVK